MAIIATALLALALLTSCSCSQPTSSASSASGSASASSEASSSEASAASSAASASAATPDPEPAPEPFYVLLVGDDTRDGTVSEGSGGHGADGYSRSDTMMLVRVDQASRLVSVVTIPRDTAATVDGATEKINEVYCRYGIQGTLDEVESLTGVRPRYYLKTTFVGFDGFVDQVGGLFVNVPVAIDLTDGVRGGAVHIDAGDQVLNGAQALAFARNRKSYGDFQDARRQAQDRKLVVSGIQKVLADPANADFYIGALLAACETDWPADDLRATVADFCAHAGEVRFVSGTGPHEGYEDPNAGGLWLVPRDEATWRRVIEVVETGGDPAEVVWVPEV